MKKRMIFVITRNSSHIWKYFIESYEKYVDKERYDLHVHDNGSREGDLEYLKTYHQDHTIECFEEAGANELFTKPCNKALERVFDWGYQQIIIVNPDIEFLKGWDKDLDQNEGIMGFVLVKDSGIIEHAGGFGGGDHIGRDELDEGQYSEIREVDWVTFGCVAIHRNLMIQKNIYLDENYPHFGSDREMCKKAKENGFKVLCSPQRLYHGYGRSTRPYVFCQVPEDIWLLHIAERRKSGVNFPAVQPPANSLGWDQNAMARQYLGV